ncbi:universal stress protein [Paenalkalicoccus suaedae]|uniref:Universal stress protein n=1 Tax=Paenalkalicoccus suaedae TaxID=2592382 RepID=A0A859FD27_9BACI|nr:universal stress protein [Paenalkalicoccus suaedae]QKS70155.1 universal stress protein [Paenalkalicoccus suaedae]
MFNRLLLAIDGSKNSVRATKKAIELAKLQLHSRIEILYVVDGKKSREDILHYGDAASYKRKQLLAPFEDMMKTKRITYHTTILHGKDHVAESIIDFANSGEFDAVVIGSRGLNALQTLVLGSVSHKVMKHVKAPVLLVK